MDRAGFTALTEVHGDHDAADLIDHFGTLARDALDADDRLVKTIGDAVMLVCLTPSAGLRLVRRITAACLTQPRFPVPRAGLHHGPAVERHDDFVGAAVNLAARVTAQATEATAVVTATIEPAARQLGWSLRAGRTVDDSARRALRAQRDRSSLSNANHARSGTRPDPPPRDPLPILLSRVRECVHRRARAVLRGLSHTATRAQVTQCFGRVTATSSRWQARTVRPRFPHRGPLRLSRSRNATVGK